MDSVTPYLVSRFSGINIPMKAINIYSVPQVANLTVAGYSTRSYMITQASYGRSTFNLFRRVQNDFDFLVRDIDRQPVVVTGTLIFHVWDDSGNALLSLPLTIVDASRGHYSLGITADDSASIRSGIYMWSVTNTDASVTKLLYVNKDYGSQGVIQVSEGLLEPIDDPFVMTVDTMTPLMQDLYSTSYPGAALSDNNTGAHTVVAYLTNYTGRLLIKASMDEQPPTDPSSWSDVDAQMFIDQSGTTVINFTGNFTYVQFTISNTPGFDKLVYRN